MPAALQVEMHPENAQNNLLRYCNNKGIHMTAFSPLGGLNYGNRDILKNQIVNDLAKKYDCTHTQILLSWARKRGTSMITSSCNEQHIKENLRTLHLHDDDFEKLNMLDCGKRYNNPADFTPEFNGFEPIFD